MKLQKIGKQQIKYYKHVIDSNKQGGNSLFIDVTVVVNSIPETKFKFKHIQGRSQLFVLGGAVGRAKRGRLPPSDRSFARSAAQRDFIELGPGVQGQQPRKFMAFLSILDAWRALQKMQIKTFQTCLYKKLKVHVLQNKVLLE